MTTYQVLRFTEEGHQRFVASETDFDKAMDKAYDAVESMRAENRWLVTDIFELNQGSTTIWINADGQMIAKVTEMASTAYNPLER